MNMYNKRKREIYVWKFKDTWRTPNKIMKNYNSISKVKIQIDPCWWGAYHYRGLLTNEQTEGTMRKKNEIKNFTFLILKVIQLSPDQQNLNCFFFQGELKQKNKKTLSKNKVTF